MELYDFFAGVADSFRNHYLALAQRTAPLSAPKVIEAPGATEAAVPADSYEPDKADAPVTYDRPTVELPAEQDNTEPSVETDNEQAAAVPSDSEPSYYYRRDARLDYALNLQFDLSAFMQTVERLAEGDSKAIDQFAAAGFGLSAALDVSGRETIKTNAGDDGAKIIGRQRSVADARQLSQFAAQGSDFDVATFSREALKVRQSLKVDVHGNHSRAVNKFALRYRLDNRFAMGFANRFNVQTQQVAEQAPDSVAQYLDTAGDLALKGSNQTMAAFFDAVDGYLGETKAQLGDLVNTFLRQAAEELGFSDSSIEAAANQLTDSIDSFFTQAATAVDSIKSGFAADQYKIMPPALDSMAPIAADSPASQQTGYVALA
jgi:hypothetical protein